MVIWYIISTILLLVGIIVFCRGRKIRHIRDNFYHIMIGMTAIFLSIILSIITTVDYYAFIEFENKIELQRTQYETLENELSNDKITYVLDIIEVNNELVDYQVQKQMFKEFSAIPERVFDIKPIGIK